MNQGRPKPSRRAKFLDRYRVDERWLQQPDIASGRPGIAEAHHRESEDRVVVKEWRRGSRNPSEDLREVWRHEVRQLHRLAGYPGAEDNIVMLYEAGEDTSGFYLILNAGRRSPLQSFLDPSRGQHWIKYPRQQSNRLLLWHNLKRIAAGLNVLHSQGILHRNLDAWAVFTAGIDEPDFLLTGFEWSVRLNGTAVDAPIRKRPREVEQRLSFYTDWQSFGLLVASLLQIDAAGLIASDAREGMDFLIGPERQLLRLLVRANPSDRIDGEVVGERIDAIIQELSAVAARRESRLYFACRLGRESKLSQAIRTASGKSIDIDDREAQLDFIRADIADQRLLVTFRTDRIDPTQQRHVVVGRQLVYRLTQFTSRQRTQPTWDIGLCEETAMQRPAQQGIVSERNLSDIQVEPLSYADADKRLPTLQGKVVSWQSLLGGESESDDWNEAEQRYLSALALVQQLEALLTAAEIWPVIVTRKWSNGGQVFVALKPRPDEERARLSSALKLKAPAVRMLEALAADQDAAREADWKLSEVGVLGEPDRETARWRFFETKLHEGAEPEHIFSSVGSHPLADALFLWNGDYVGKDKLLRRRANALKVLREHSELLRMLVDARASVRPTHDLLQEDESFADLDPSKQQALRELWSVLPMYLVQGPPGVGKTRLVRELVARRFSDDATTRLLLTAQSHAAIDHLMDEVHKVLGGHPSQPVVVRCRPRDQEGQQGPYDLREQSRTIVDRFADSELVAQAPAKLRKRVGELRAAFGADEDDDAPRQRPDRSFEGLLLRAANIVFASTNSRELERLVEERGQVDWTIVEEAGKATGVELVAPLLLSHRRLMIGDHKQLPPFGADQLKKLLADPAKVKEAREVGTPLVARSFRDDDVFVESDDDQSVARVCAEAISLVLLFETMVSQEVGGKPAGTRLPIAMRLTHQHRMHPAIAELVSHSFYDGTLVTDGKAIEKFRTGPAPIRSLDRDRLPASPIVFIDMPYVQDTIGKRWIEKLPRYHNAEECSAVLAVLDQLRSTANGSSPKPTLAVLSPYAEQVRRLRTAILDNKSGRLSHLSEFAPAGGDSAFVGTVDSFQGNEADVVVVSLVRNNQHAGPSALGFLRDARRMNVLLSRAKWKLIIVGSLKFLDRRFSEGEMPSRDDELYFLWKVLETVRGLSSQRDEQGSPRASITPSAKLLGVAQ